MRGCGVAAVVVAGILLVAGPGFGGPAEDSEIARKVDDQLRRSAIVGHMGLRARARDGRVILDGRVRTLSQSWEAEDLAGKVRGVREVENRIDIETKGAGDRSIEAAVRRRFEDLPEIAAAGLTVTAEGGTLTLAGKVRDARKRFTAADAAAQVEGVVAIVDRIETPPKDDESLRKDVAGILSSRSLARVAGKIEPTVKDGVVTLEGNVPRLYDRKRAERLVLGVNGVRAVEDRLEVKPSSPDLLIPLH